MHPYTLYLLLVSISAPAGVPIDVHIDGGTTHAVSPTQTGANGNLFSHHIEYDDPALRQAIQDMGVLSWRFPGGSVANGYNAANGMMYGDIRDNWIIYNEIHTNGLTCEDYAALAQLMPGHVQDYVANLYSRPDPADPTGTTSIVMTTQAEYGQEASRLRSLLEQLLVQGFDPPFIELSNELYLTGLWPEVVEVDDYAARIAAFTPELRAVYPNTSFGVALPLDHEFRNYPGNNENVGLDDWEVPTDLDYQAVVLHAYVTAWYELQQYLEGNATIADVMTNWFVQVDLGMDACMEYTALHYPGRDTWVTEWGVLGVPDSLEAVFHRSTLRVMEAASMVIEMAGHSEIKLANLHGFIPTLGPDEMGGFNPIPLGVFCTHVNAVIAAHGQAVGTSSNSGSVTATIGVGGTQGWGGFSAPAIADVLLADDDGQLQWLAINRTPEEMDIALHVGDVGVTIAQSTITRVFTAATNGDSIDLLVEPTMDVVDAGPVVDGVLAVAIPAMGFVSVEISPVLGDANGDGTIGVSDLLAVIDAWGPCAECQADVTGDGFVDVEDLLTVITNWGPWP